MSATFRDRSIATLFFILIVWSGFAAGGESLKESRYVSDPTFTCNTSGECSAEISGLSKILDEACQSPRISLTWNRSVTGLYLITCDCECTSYDNSGWIVQSATANKAALIVSTPLGRESTIADLKRSPKKIPGLYGPNPMCEPIDYQKLRTSIFVSLFKQPTNSEEAPYCYSAGYISEINKGEPFITANNAVVSAYIQSGLTDSSHNSVIKNEIERIAAEIQEEKQNSICTDGERNILSFRISRSKKIASVCEGPAGEYLVYRFGAVNNVELEFPSKLGKEAWSEFRYSGYIRGGGIANDAMGDYSLSFSNNGVEYTVFQNWRLASNEYSLGVAVHTGERSIILKGIRDTQTGALELLNGNPHLRNAWNSEE